MHHEILNHCFFCLLVSSAALADPIRRIEIDTVSIPEPASMVLIGLFSGGLYFARRFCMAWSISQM